MTRLLLVEDDADLVAVLRPELGAAGFDVSVAGHGQHALALSATAAPEIVVLDWGLPDIDGLTLLSRLRERLTAPILMLTARASEQDRVTGLAHGADDYLPKPFGTAELVARLRALLRLLARTRRQLAEDDGPTERRIVCGALDVDTRRWCARLDGDELSLTPIELQLLALLLRHPGRTFSRTYLLDRIWGDHGESGPRAVDNSVSRLRRKLGTHAGRLQSVWGVGYRWCET